jgi:hypothetical protein
VKGDPRIRYDRDDATPDEQHDRELRAARDEIRRLNHRVGLLEKTVRAAAHVLNTAEPRAMKNKREANSYANNAGLTKY